MLSDGQQRWADLLAVEALREPTQPLPLISPLLTPGQMARTWRSIA